MVVCKKLFDKKSSFNVNFPYKHVKQYGAG